MATPAPNIDSTTDLNPNLTYPQNTPKSAAEDIANTTEITLVGIVCDVCKI